MRRITIDHAFDFGADRILLDEIQERREIVKFRRLRSLGRHRGFGTRCRGFCRRRNCPSIRWWCLWHGHRLHRRASRLGTTQSCSRLTTRLLANRQSLNENPPDIRHGLAADQSSFVEQPFVLVMKFLITIVRQHARLDFVGDRQNEAVASANGASRRRNQFVVVDRFVKLGPLAPINPMTKCRIDDNRYFRRRKLFHERQHRFVQLFEARLGSTLGRKIRTVNYDVRKGFYHPLIQPPLTCHQLANVWAIKSSSS